MKRIGVYGGSFDPIHLGHLLLAETAREFCSLDRIYFVPAGIPPHKQGRKRASGEDRFQMIRLAVQDCDDYWVSRFEIDSGEISYTVRTLRYFQRLFPDDRLFLITGSDTLNDIPNWFEPQEICRLASLIVGRKAGFPAPDFSEFRSLASSEKILEYQNQIVPIPQIELTSSSIRRKIADGKSVRFQIPRDVERYIRERGLYLDD